MKTILLILLASVCLAYYVYNHTTLLNEYFPRPLALNEDSAQPKGEPNFVELTSKEGKVIQAVILSRGPVGIRAQRLDGKTFEIPFERLDSQTVNFLQGIQSFPYPNMAQN